MADISQKVMSLIHNTEAGERFHVARDLCWQIERGLFDCLMEIDRKYDPDEIRNQRNASYILDDYGFTVVSNGKEPFFAVFPEPEEGFGHFLNDQEELQKIFAALSRADTFRALIWLYHRTDNYVFESAVLARNCEIPDERMAEVLDDLLQLRVVWKQELIINGENRTLYYSKANHKLIALFLVAGEIGYRGAYDLQAQHRTTPLIREECCATRSE